MTRLTKPKTQTDVAMSAVAYLLFTAFVLMLLLGVLRAGLHPAIPAPGYGTTVALLVVLNLLVPRWRKRS